MTRPVACVDGYTLVELIRWQPFEVAGVHLDRPAAGLLGRDRLTGARRAGVVVFQVRLETLGFVRIEGSEYPSGDVRVRNVRVSH